MTVFQNISYEGIRGGGGMNSLLVGKPKGRGW
jgi:hypothetical protein